MAVKSILGQLLFEKKPTLPELQPLDLATEQGKAVAGNQAVLPAAEKLATETNRFNQDELLKGLRASIPNFDELVSGVSGNIASGLKGEIPKDVQDQVQNNAAAKALAGGYGGTGMSGNLLARDLGLTSYGIAQKALDSAQRWLQVGSQSLTAPRFDVSTMFVSPSQQASFDINERNTQWNYQWFKNQLAAQPEPWQKAVEGLLDWVANTGLSVAGAYAGNISGITGGMGGGGGAAPSMNSAGMGIG